ncbi:MAG: hypothetical protein AAF621_07425 [Pseudomonadota bacterium]
MIITNLITDFADTLWKNSRSLFGRGQVSLKSSNNYFVKSLPEASFDTLNRFSANIIDQVQNIHSHMSNKLTPENMRHYKNMVRSIPPSMKYAAGGLGTYFIIKTIIRNMRNDHKKSQHRTLLSQVPFLLAGIVGAEYAMQMLGKDQTKESTDSSIDLLDGIIDEDNGTSKKATKGKAVDTE